MAKRQKKVVTSILGLFDESRKAVVNDRKKREEVLAELDKLNLGYEVWDYPIVVKGVTVGFNTTIFIKDDVAFHSALLASKPKAEAVCQDKEE